MTPDDVDASNRRVMVGVTDAADTMAGREIAELADHRDALVEALLDTFRTGTHA